jgi:predicted TIM-barrel fold metal-dependent hydrolase
VADLQFTDTHVHFYDLSEPALRYEWLLPDAPIDEVTGPDHAIRAQRYWADDFLAEVRFHNVGHVIHVQAAVGIADPVEETRWLQSFADRLGAPHGIVAYADLTAPDVSDVLAGHAKHPNLRGIRDLRYDAYLTDERWRRGFALLEQFGLVCCDDPEVEQMEIVRDLADRHPGIPFCIDHAGFPKRRDREYYEEWRAGLRKAAAASSTVIKISGLGQVDHRWTVESIRPWVLECIEVFGTDRSFFGTNWPLDRLYSSYGDVIDAYAEIVAEFTAGERAALFSGNADRIFSLGPDHGGMPQ